MPNLPFYIPREGPRVHEGERERGKEEREKIEKKRALGLRHPSPPQVGPAGPANDNGIVRMS
jgi:hypothetical protein